MLHRPLLPQCVLCHPSLQGEAGCQNAQGNPRLGEQECYQRKSQSRSGRAAFHEGERDRKESGGWQ